MKDLRITRRAACAFAVISFISASAHAAFPLYRITDLGALPVGPNGSIAYGLSDAGHVVGLSGNPNTFRPFVWQAGSGMRDLSGYIAGDALTQPLGVNNTGQVVGVANGRPFLWQAGGGVLDLGHLPGGDVSASAVAINNAGQVVGSSSAATGGRAYVWQAGTGMRDLGSLPGGDYDMSAGRDINESGQVVGYSRASSGFRAFLWQADSGMQDLGELEGGGNYSLAEAINDVGQVVGESYAATGNRAFLWQAGSGMEDLGDLPGGDDYSTAYDINNAGQVVGRSSTANGYRPFLWQNGQMVNLNGLLDPSDPLAAVTTLWDATAINEAGQIVGGALINGVWRAYMVSPVPEPETWGMMLAGLGLVGAIRYRRRAMPTAAP